MKQSFSLVAIAVFVLALTAGCKKADPKAQTIENLKAAFTGETTASAKYAAYAKKAKEEGHAQIAVLFEAASKAEGFHAVHETEVLKKLGVTMDPVTPKFDVKTTAENLKDALAGETHEVTGMYPGFVKIAEEAKLDDAAQAFNWALAVEKKHMVLYQQAIDALAKKDLKTLAGSYYVCQLCGNTVAAQPGACDICAEPKEKFVTVK